ncbi:hypothetical protein LEM8419_01079 [Neolewinella maritima]|uniref:EI24 domain-containing protein n=1 Tax=Neolewinella maritima TaxID=1383882 RepID=A0ABM9AZM4_9BACT|nr:hypothetical protein [Neolewinella maritima]CAH0999779.1 hypothetical protein LEM8419_01079 [Neolewinella maritima]
MERDRLTRLRYGVHEFFYTLMTFPRAWRFMRNHQLWRGLRQYGWVARGLVVIGVLIGLTMISEVVEWWNEHADAPITAMAIGADSLVVRWFWEGYESLSDGALNWVVLVLLEVVIYHFMRQTLRVVLDKDVENAHLFKPFLQAQVRMIKVSLVALIVQESLVGLSASLLPGVLDWGFALAVQSAVLGFAIADNYSEQFDLGIRQSLRYFWRNYIGVCLGLGLPLFLMLKVPVFGTVLGPLVTSVAAAIVLREKSDLHLVGYQRSEKEQRRYEARQIKQQRKADRKAARRARKTT